MNIAHNHQLKAIFKWAATTVIKQWPDDPLYRDYERLLAGGTKRNLAKLTLARKIAAIVLSMWKNEEVCDPDKHRKPATEQHVAVHGTRRGERVFSIDTLSMDEKGSRVSISQIAGPGPRPMSFHPQTI